MAAALTPLQADKRVSFLLGQMPTPETWSLHPRNAVAVAVYRRVLQHVDNRVLLGQLLIMKTMWPQPPRKAIVALTVPWSVIHVDRPVLWIQKKKIL
jgi:hypothetical protein